jgi:hypothetical protein
MQINCADCGQPFIRASNVQKHCPSCAIVRRKAKQAEAKRIRCDSVRPKTVVCDGCGATVPKVRHAQRLCDSCKRTRKNARDAARQGRHRARKNSANPHRTKTFMCCDCGVTFPRKTPGSRQKRCDPCREVEKKRAGLEGSRKHRSEHKEAIALQIAERRREDPKFALRHSFSAAVWKSIKDRKSGRPWERLVGYTVTELMLHLERQFVRLMSWKNYGREWEVDHIRPVSSFSFTRPEDQGFKDCWALSNLRPLWRGPNRSKRDKRMFLL